jgi:hypothetical protein
MGLGTSTPEDNSPPPQALAENQENSFSFVVPTEFVELPSKGRFYSEGHPLHGQETIEIKQMTAKEEDILTSRSLLKKGIALDRVIKSIIMNKRIDPDSLLVGDRNAIIVATRISGYGSEYATQVSCPSCTTKQEYTFNLNSANIYGGENVSELDIVSNEDNTFTVQLPKTLINITFRLLSGKDEKSFIAGMETDRKQRQTTEKNVTRQIASMVVAVNGDSSLQAIKYLVDNIPSIDSRHLRLAYRLAAPNVDLTQHFECNECDFEQDMEVPLTADFFWPDR